MRKAANVKSILIREVPDEIRLQLKDRARSNGKSLQQYLLDELTRLAERPAMEEVLERLGSRDSGRIDMETVIRDLDEVRRSRTG